jgi:hypothetical protein
MDVIAMALSAEPASLSVVRERVRRWLDRLEWPAEEVDDVVLAVNEAASLVVEHALSSAGPSQVRVAGRPFTDAESLRRVAVGVVGDVGWSPAAAATALPGYGVLTIHTCMESVDLQRDADGTTVFMTSVPVPSVR